jgi:thiamine biosynthesis lipoprotein ApbE
LTKGFFVLGFEDGLKFANEHGIAVLFLLREETGIQRGPGPRFIIKEVMSDAFMKKVKVLDGL